MRGGRMVRGGMVCVLLPAAVLTVLLATPAGRAWACSFATRAMQGDGVPGVPIGGAVSDAAAPPSPFIPRNAAFFTRADAPLRVEANSQEVELVPLGPEPRPGELTLVTVVEPLVEGARVVLDGGSHGGNGEAFIASDVIDDSAPEMPHVSGGSMHVSEGETACASDSCGDRATVAFQLEAPTDDHTASEHLAYALYLGRSPKAVADKQQPVAFLLLEAGEVFAFVDFRWSERDVYASLTALDRAGNESERTEPTRIYDAPGACAVAAAAFPLSDLAWIGAALCLLACRRR